MHARLHLSSEPGFPISDTLAAYTLTQARGGVIHRDATVFADAMTRGVMVAIIDEAGDVGDPDSLLAIAGVLPLEAGLFELGGALVHEAHTGFGLQKPMMQARLMAYFGLKIAPLENLRTGAGRARYGDPSRRVLEAAGFLPIRHADAPVDFYDECKTCTRGAPAGHQCCYQYYTASPACRTVPYEPGVREIVRKSDGRTLRLTLPELQF
ncbi:MAG: hypothetical protein P8P99_13985 [Maricaulis sp.]|nr:hypothetical protein [Maricaulis sp.]